MPDFRESTIVRVFDGEMIASALQANAAVAVSDPIPVRGNSVVLAAQCVNTAGGGVLSLYLEGTYNGKVWRDSGLPPSTGSALGYMPEMNLTQCKFSYLRVKAVLSAGTQMFNVALAFNQL